MQKLKLWAPLVLLCITAPLFAGTYTVGGPTTTNNDDSCDIALLPAATLLLPYFEVDINNISGETTLFTVTNTTSVPQVAHVTLWSDYSYPVINFNLYLTGYDVQSINLYDVIVRGIIAPDLGTGSDISPEGEISDSINPKLNLDNCDELPGAIPSVYVNYMKKAFTEGTTPAFGSIAECTKIGGVHANATGYVTIDVARRCGIDFPNRQSYFEQDILWDNVFTGDFMQVHSTNNYAQGNPMVHIRAVPEGGVAQDRFGNSGAYHVNLNNTFYGHYEGGGKLNARQPLPARFAARWIDGGTSGFQTYYKIWREAKTNASTQCGGEYELKGGKIPVTEILMFDEEENPFMVSEPICCIGVSKELPASSMTPVSDKELYPPNPNGALAGWMYFNLDNAAGDNLASQNWIVTSMRAQGRFSTDVDTTALGNGCSPELPQSEIYNELGPTIGPSANVNP